MHLIPQKPKVDDKDDGENKQQMTGQSAVEQIVTLTALY